MAKQLRGGLLPATDGSVATPPLVSNYEPKNRLQRELRRVWRDSHVILLTGEAGTGKTSGAMGEALQDLLNERIRKIVVTRPPVPCGPSIGYLEGSLIEKMAPYMSSLGDAMDSFTNATFAKLGAKIEIADIGTLQGRTIKDAVLVCDEASNVASRQQLVCLATRVGKNGKIVLAGDEYQSNLRVRPNPFAEFAADHANTPGVTVLKATREDQLRSGFVRDFLEIEEQIQRERGRERDA